MVNIVRIGLSALLVSLIVAASAQQKTIRYTVREGDNLFTISRKFGLLLPDLLAVNQFQNPHQLKPGMVINIPVKGTTGTKSPTTPNRTTSVKSGWAEINKDRINIRKGPGTHTDRITIVDRWTKVQVLSRQGEWSQVKLHPSGRVGWVLSQYLSPTTPPRQVASANRRTQRSSERKATAQKANSLAQRRQPSRSSAIASVKAPSDRTQAIIQRAMGYLGHPYRRGGTSARGFDCSGFTTYIFRQHGIQLPRTSASQAGVGKPVPRNQLQPGDLVFFRTRGRRISHVGIYIGNGKFVHSSSARGRVRVDTLNSGYYYQRYAGARRVTK
ncbi:MAG: NlpC/P60 family protein [Fimbriimonadales bacterium]